MISHEELRRTVHYDPETGVMSWKDRGDPRFNKALAGQPCHLRTHPDGTYLVTIKKTPYRLHRLTWFYMTGEWPDRVRNKSGDFSDNRWSNLANGSRADDAFRQAEKVAARKAEQHRLALEKKALSEAARTAKAQAKALAEPERQLKLLTDAIIRKVHRIEARAAYLRNNAEEIAVHKREHQRAKKQQYKQNNPHKVRADKARYRARRRDALDLTANTEKIAAVYKLSQRMQEITGKPYHVDHLVPLAKGGKHHEDNLVVMSGPLNELKSDHIIPELIRFFGPQS